MKTLTRLLGGALLAGLGACQPPAFPLDPPSAYDPDIDDTPPPVLSAAEIGAALPDALEAFFVIDPEELFNNYDGVRLQFDDNDPAAEGACPRYDLERDDGVQAWSADPCTAQSGAVFSDSLESFISPAGTTFTDDDGASFTILADGFIGGTGRIFDPSGARFDATGEARFTRFSPDATPGDTISEFDIRGAYFWNGNGSAGTWLPDNYSIDFTVEAVDAPSAQLKSIRINGIVSGLPGTFNTIIFGDTRNVATNDGVTVTCSQEPANSIQVRDANGNWYQMFFQGARNPGENNADACDGCGFLQINNNEEFETELVCADFSRLLNWGGRPW